MSIQKLFDHAIKITATNAPAAKKGSTQNGKRMTE
jgi:hypothetical protein